MTPEASFDRRPGTKQKIYNKFQAISPVPDYTIAEIKEIRRELGLSQSMLAGILGVAQRTVEAWEIGHKVPGGSARRLLTILKTDTGAIRRSGIAEW